MCDTCVVPKRCLPFLVAATATSARARGRPVAIGILAAVCGAVSCALAQPQGGTSATPAEWLVAIEKQATAEAGG
jgi:hypothetical protein